MKIRVPAAGTASLDDAEDCKKFDVESAGIVEGDLGAVLGVLGDWADGGTDGHVWIRADAMRAAAAGRVPEGWESDFEAMIAFARSKGWMNDAGTAIRAHVVYGA